ADREGYEGRARGGVRRGQVLGVEAQFLAHVGGDGAVRVGRDLPGHGLGQVRRDALVHEYLGEPVQLPIAVALVLQALKLDFRQGQLVLRLDRDVLAGRHRERPGDQPGDAGQDDRAVRAAARADTQISEALVTTP